jgi:hypothetical protein
VVKLGPWFNDYLNHIDVMLAILFTMLPESYVLPMLLHKFVVVFSLRFLHFSAVSIYLFCY